MNDIIKQLKNNRIGIIPHDTIPGIVARMSDTNAQRMIQIKQRSKNKGFIILIPNIGHLNSLVLNVTKQAQQLVNQLWPGPLTLIFNKKESISSTITGSDTTIAIRYPNNIFLNKVLNELNEPLMSTSANMSTETSISKEIVDLVDFCDESIECNTFLNSNEASTIVRCTDSTSSIIRSGSIPQEIINATINL